MGSKNQVTLTFAGDEAQLNKSFQSVGSAADRFGKSVGKSSRDTGIHFKKMGADAEGTKKGFAGLGAQGQLLTGVLAGFGGSVALSAFNDMTNLASSAGETFNKATTIFGAGFGDIEKWASTAKNTMGMSKTAALDAAAGFGNLFSQLGFGQEDVNNMSKSMVQLGVDFASFHGIEDVTSVIEAQSSAFRGEYDALQKFIPTISAATVEQKALEMSGKKATKELTAQEKAAAVQAFMMENAGAAMGDYAKTSNSAMGQSKKSAAAMEEMNVAIGQKLLPAQMKWNQAKLAFANVMVDKVLPALDRIGGFIQANQGPFTALALVVGGALTAAFVMWAISAGAAAVATIAATWPVLAIGAAVAVLAFIVIKNWSTIKEWTVKVFTAVWTFIKQAFEVVKNLFMSYINIYITIYKKIGQAIMAVWNGAVSFVGGAMSKIGGIISGAVNTAKGIIAGVPNAIKGIMSGVANTITAPFKAGFQGIRNAWNSTVGGRGFSVPGWVPPPMGGKSFRIPALADGGVVTGPTLALVGEGRGPEAVIPLDRMEQFGGGTTTIVLDSGGSRLDELLLEILQKAISIQGGNVQAVLGR